MIKKILIGLFLISGLSFACTGENEKYHNIVEGTLKEGVARLKGNKLMVSNGKVEDRITKMSREKNLDRQVLVMVYAGAFSIYGFNHGYEVIFE